MKIISKSVLIITLLICCGFTGFGSGMMNTPTASTTRAGKVKADGATITIQPDGTISAVSGGTGNVTGPASSTANKVPQWNNTAGTLLKDGLTVGTAASNLIQLDSNSYLPAIDAHLLTGFAPGKYHYVDASTPFTSGFTGGVNFPYKTVQGCIDAASSGETCFIWPGSYTENLTLKAGVNLSTTGKFSVTITGNHITAFAGTVVIENIILTSATGVTLSATNSANSMNLQFIGSDINSGTGDAVNWLNTNAASKLSITDGNVNVATSGVSARAIYAGASSAGTFMLNRSSIKLNNPANVAVALNGAVAYNHTADAIYGQLTVANTASATVAMCTMTATGVATITTSSSGNTILLNNILTTNTTPAIAGVGGFVYSALIYGSTGVGGAATLNGGYGALPLTMAPFRLRTSTLFPAGSVAAGLLTGTFEFDGTDLWFTAGTSRKKVTLTP